MSDLCQRERQKHRETYTEQRDRERDRERTDEVLTKRHEGELAGVDISNSDPTQC